ATSVGSAVWSMTTISAPSSSFGSASDLMSGSWLIVTLGSPGFSSRTKMSASDGLASTNTPRTVSSDFCGYDATPASASTVCISTLAPAVQSTCVASSSSLWLTPSLQGTNTIAAGTTVARLQAS